MTVCSSTQRRKRKMTHKMKFQKLSNHDEFLDRITKTLYYGKIPISDRFSLPVSELAAELFSEVKREYSLDRLYVDEAAEISRNACVSPCSLVLALLYLERLKTCNSEYVEKVSPSELFLVSMIGLTLFNISRCVSNCLTKQLGLRLRSCSLICNSTMCPSHHIMVASKFLHDDGEEDEVFNDEWAFSGGLEVKDMNRLEREFLNAIDWEVYVSEQAFWNRLQRMETELALREGKQRGWFSYMELAHLVSAIELASLAHTLITVSAVCLTSYTASVLAMVGSTVVVNQIPSIATSLVSTTLPSPLLPVTSVLLAQIPPSPDSCLTNETLVNKSSLLWHQWRDAVRRFDEQDVSNHSSLEEKSLSAQSHTHLADNKWQNHLQNNHIAKDDWLKTLTDLVKIASTSTSPSMLMPVEILTY